MLILGWFILSVAIIYEVREETNLFSLSLFLFDADREPIII